MSISTKRSLPSPTSSVQSKKAAKDSETEKTLHLYTTSIPWENDASPTDYFNSISNNVLIINATLCKSGSVLKILRKDLGKALSKENWKVDVETKLTTNFINQNSYCLNKVDKDKPLDDIKDKIETLLETEVVHIERLERSNLIIFVTLELNSKIHLEKEINIDQHLLQVKKYDPVVNYIYRCKSCHSFNHISCSKKVCYKCHSENCTPLECPKDKIKVCLNCKKNHSTFYKGCEKYQKAFDSAKILRLDKVRNTKIKKIEQSVLEYREINDKSQASYSEITKKNESDISTISKTTESNKNDISSNSLQLKTLLQKIEKLESENTELKKRNQELEKMQKTFTKLENQVTLLNSKFQEFSNEDIPEKSIAQLFAMSLVKTKDKDEYLKILKDYTRKLYQRDIDITKLEYYFLLIGFSKDNN